MDKKPEPATAASPTIDEEQLWLGRKVLQALYSTIKAAMVYEANNRGYRARADKFGTLLHDYLEHFGSLRIDYYNDHFFVDKIRLRYGSPEFAQDHELARLFDELKLGRLEFGYVPEAGQLDKAVFVLAHLDRQANDPFELLQASWEEFQLTEIGIYRLAPKIANRLSTDDDILENKHQQRQRAGTTYFRTADLLEEFTKRIENTKTFHTAKAQRVIHDLIDHIVRDETSLLEFAAIKDFDDYTYAHSTNVCVYSIALGLRLGLDKRRVSQLGYAALFHDAGKIKLPQDLISKKAEFNEDDWKAIRQHPILGALTLAAMPATDEHNTRGVIVAYEHHLNIDGGGYPETPESRDPNLFSRIVAIADSYDAMTSGRVYKKYQISPDEALRRLLQQSGTRYDPLVLRAFVHLLGIFPVGTIVRLSTGQQAVVCANDLEDLYRPEVQIIDQSSSPTAPVRMALNAKDLATGEYPAYITKIIPPSEAKLTAGTALGLTDYLPTGADRLTGIE